MNQIRLTYCSVIVMALKIAKASNPDDAPEMANEIVHQIELRCCMDIDRPTPREGVQVYRCVMRKALEMTRQG
jgi:hypothetical protein